MRVHVRGGREPAPLIPPLYQPSIPAATDTGHSPFVHSPPPSDDLISTTNNVRVGGADGGATVVPYVVYYSAAPNYSLIKNP